MGDPAKCRSLTHRPERLGRSARRPSMKRRLIRERISLIRKEVRGISGRAESADQARADTGGHVTGVIAADDVSGQSKGENVVCH